MASTADLVFLCFALISAIFYIYTLVILIRKRSEPPFNSHFFRLCISLGIADLCSGLNAYVMLGVEWKWIDFSYLYEHPSLGRFVRPFPKVTFVFIGICQYVGVMTLALNRYYNVEATLWTSNKQRIALLAQWCIPSISVIPYVSQDFHLSWMNVSDGVAMVSDPERQWHMKYLALMSLGQLIIVIIVTILYCRIYSHIRQIKNDFGITQDNRSELKLALVGLILLILMLAQRILLGGMVASTFVLDEAGFSAIRKVLGIILHQLNIVFAFVNPFLLFGCSQATRQALLGPFYRTNTVGPAAPEAVEMNNLPPPTQPLRARPAVPENINM